MKIPFAIAVSLLLAGCGDPVATPDPRTPIPPGTANVFTVGGDGEVYAITAGTGVAHVGLNGVSVLPVPEGVYEIHRAGTGAIALVEDSLWYLEDGQASRLPARGYMMGIIETPERTFLRVYSAEDRTQLYLLDGPTLTRLDSQVDIAPSKKEVNEALPRDLLIQRALGYRMLD